MHVCVLSLLKVSSWWCMTLALHTQQSATALISQPLVLSEIHEMYEAEPPVMGTLITCSPSSVNALHLV